MRPLPPVPTTPMPDGRTREDNDVIKCMMFVYRAPHLSREEFFAYWADKHATLAIANAPLMRMKRYVQNHRREHEAGDLFQQSRGCVMGDFDGVAEAWWDSFDDMLAGGASTPEDVAQAILEDERQFVDIERSIIWFAEEMPRYPVEQA